MDPLFLDPHTEPLQQLQKGRVGRQANGESCKQKVDGANESGGKGMVMEWGGDVGEGPE